MTQSRSAFHAAYATRLRDHLAETSERSLHRAYELGREAVLGELSVLEVAAAHQEALLDALRSTVSGRRVEQVTVAAGDFFLEVLGAFEMVQRGVREAREAAIAERRASRMLRQLSSLLADPSLALDQADAPAEALRLVAEEARELTHAGWCVATAALESGRPLTEIAGDADADGEALALACGPDLRVRHAIAAAAAGAVRLTAQELEEHSSFPSWHGGDHSAFRGWMGAPLRFLDGRNLGCLEVFDSARGEFGELDEAVLVNLAQMASAALERAHLYRRHD